MCIRDRERFARQLAIERRMHRDQQELEARKAQVKGMLKPRSR